MNKSVPDLSSEMDLDRIELQDFKFLPGDTIVLYSRKNDAFTHWRVLQVLDEMINIQMFELDNQGKPI